VAEIHELPGRHADLDGESGTDLGVDGRGPKETARALAFEDHSGNGGDDDAHDRGREDAPEEQPVGFLEGGERRRIARRPS
jgi:hypothetical protein